MLYGRYAICMLLGSDSLVLYRGRSQQFFKYVFPKSYVTYNRHIGQQIYV